MTTTILTKNGSYFNFLSPYTCDIDIESIAHALSHICRFTGHTRQFYSVAQHSVMVSLIVPPELAFAGLLHDAAEAYIGDVSKPLKTILPDYAAIESNVEKAIFTYFEIGEDAYHDDVKRADMIMLLTEMRDLMPAADDRWHIDGIKPRAEKLVPLDAYSAKRMFLQRFNHLQNLQSAA